MTRRRVAAALALVFLGGCGYSLRGNLPSHLTTIAIPTFANRTQEPGVENFLTSAMIQAFASNGRLRVVKPEQADSLLEGVVVGYEVQSVAFDQKANVRQYRLLVTMNLVFRDLRRNEVIFAQSGVQERADFTVAGAVSETISREESSVRQAAVDIARTVVSRAVERF